MSYRYFNLIIDGDSVPFQRIELDDATQIPIAEEEIGIYNMLISDPTVINVNHLEYVPLIGSEWDGEDFIDPLNQEVRPVRRQDPDPNRFSFTVDNKHSIYYVLSKHEGNKMMAAALSSNPKIEVKGNE